MPSTCDKEPQQNQAPKPNKTNKTNNSDSQTTKSYILALKSKQTLKVSIFLWLWTGRLAGQTIEASIFRGQNNYKNESNPECIAPGHALFPAHATASTICLRLVTVLPFFLTLCLNPNPNHAPRTSLKWRAGKGHGGHFLWH